MSSALRYSLLALALVLVTAGCGSAIDVDVKCEKLCLVAPGPTLPGIPAVVLPTALDGGIAGVDGGVAGSGGGVAVLDGGEYAIDGGEYAIDGGVPALALDGGVSASEGATAGSLAGLLPSLVPPTVEWVADLSFNEVLRQLPSAAANLSADVRLGSIALVSTHSLDFIESLEVTLSHGAAASTGLGAAPAEVEPTGSGPACSISGTAIRVAAFHRSEGVIVGSSLELEVAVPQLNLFDCMKDEPSRFRVTLIPRAGGFPAADTPLALRTCVAAETHARYP